MPSSTNIDKHYFHLPFNIAISEMQSIEKMGYDNFTEYPFGIVLFRMTPKDPMLFLKYIKFLCEI